MKKTVKKIINKVSMGLPHTNSTGINGNDAAPGTAAIHLPSSHHFLFTECYDALLWMNESMKQLEGLMDWLI